MAAHTQKSTMVYICIFQVPSVLFRVRATKKKQKYKGTTVCSRQPLDMMKWTLCWQCLGERLAPKLSSCNSSVSSCLLHLDASVLSHFHAHLTTSPSLSLFFRNISFFVTELIGYQYIQFKSPTHLFPWDYFSEMTLQNMRFFRKA